MAKKLENSIYRVHSNMYERYGIKVLVSMRSVNFY